MLLLKPQQQLQHAQRALLVLTESPLQSTIIVLVYKDSLKGLFSLKVAKLVTSLVIDVLDQTLINVLIVIWLATESQQLLEHAYVCQDFLILDSLTA